MANMFILEYTFVIMEMQHPTFCLLNIIQFKELKKKTGEKRYRHKKKQMHKSLKFGFPSVSLRTIKSKSNKKVINMRR